MILKIFLICVIVSSVNQIYAEVSDLKPIEQTFKQEEKSAPKSSIQDELLTVNFSNIPNVREGEIAFKEMCMKNGGNESYDQATVAIKNIWACFDGILSFAELPTRVSKAKPTGELDIVFKDYCSRSNELKGCVYKFLGEIEPCLANYQKSSKYTMQNITEAILKFVCDNEGDHIALFISENGVDCIVDKQKGIEQCIKSGMNDSSDERLNLTSWNNLTNIGNVEEQQFKFSFELQQCRVALAIQKCIIRELQKCSGSTPANVVESVFKLIHNSTTCSRYSWRELDPEYNAGVSIYQSMLTIIIPALTVLLVRTFSIS